ncbi:MAG: hypothetical protein COB46_04405 [Rhodospirillaceae bacterium]|nr:MAG: hypothetical protein COB46_04405 [Rhodospirillaceae bacterium]
MTRLCILSPHLDDAVWSLGGWLARQHEYESVVVITVFDGDPEEANLGQLREAEHTWRMQGSPHLRRNEDIRALETLGCLRLGLGCLDAPMRRDKGRYIFPTPESMFDDLIPMRDEIVEDVGNRLMNVLGEDDRLIAPLSLGKHCDHRVVSEVAQNISAPVFGWYEDFPYVEGMEEKIISERASFLAGERTEPSIVAVDRDQWLKAALQYRSQVIRLFGNSNNFTKRLNNHCSHNEFSAALRIWRTASSYFSGDPSAANK